jgi:uncharacterized membrane protein YphA (DoxX/SURF4 family)
MNERVTVGVTPWLPWPLSRWDWWTEPVRAERLAALRIGLAIVLLVDVLVQYLPHYADFFGAGSLGSPEVFAGRNTGHWHWSPLRGLEDARLFLPILLIWLSAAFLLLIGWKPRLAAVVAWVLSISVLNLNYYLHNSGDRIRNIILFYLMLTPCGAAWSLDNCIPRKRGGHKGPVYISPWALRLLFVQMALIYFFNGFYKLMGADWRDGDVLHFVLGNVQWARWSITDLPVPYGVTRVLTWLIVIWEIGFPLFVSMRPIRNMTLWFGVLLHLGMAVSLQLGMFSFYMLCLYLPLVPWERWSKRIEQ